MSVRSRLATAPWPVRLAVGLVFLGAWAWPFLLVHPPAFIQVMVTGLVAVPISAALRRRRDRKATGWDPARQQELLRAARRGSPPADPADLRRLRRLVADDVRQDSGLRWVGTILAIPCFGVLLFGVFFEDLAAGWVGAGALWFPGARGGLVGADAEDRGGAAASAGAARRRRGPPGGGRPAGGGYAGAGSGQRRSG